MKLINLTPHEINILGGSGVPTTDIPPSGSVARLATYETLVEEIDGIPYFKQSIGRVVGLPPYESGVRYIVSTAVRVHLPERPDLASPGYPQRDENGRIIGTTGLIINEVAE